jgi:hypothetical protein
MLCAHFVWRLDEREIGIVRYNRFWERSELHALATEIGNFLNYLSYRALTAIKNGAELNRRSFDDASFRKGHCFNFFGVLEQPAFDRVKASQPTLTWER